MINIKFDSSKRALAIVAHPDDETIWMGGFISKHRHLAWTIFSLCRASDPDRFPKFLKVCRHYRAKAIITDLEDGGRTPLAKTISLIKKLIAENIDNIKFDYIFTHGANGEYGHPRHLGVHQAVNQLIKEKKLSFNKIHYFNYAKTSRREFSPLVIKEDCDLTLKLTAAEYARKKKVMTNLYGFDPNGIDANYCTNPEGFKVRDEYQPIFYF